MTTSFLDQASAVLRGKLQTEYFEKSVSLRIKDVGNLIIFQDTVTPSDDKADCAIIADQETFEKILNGTLNPMKAAKFGKLKIAGDAKTAIQFGALFS